MASGDSKVETPDFNVGVSQFGVVNPRAPPNCIQHFVNIVEASRCWQLIGGLIAVHLEFSTLITSDMPLGV